MKDHSVYVEEPDVVEQLGAALFVLSHHLKPRLTENSATHKAYEKVIAAFNELASTPPVTELERAAREIVATTAEDLGYCAEDVEQYRFGALDGDEILAVQAVERALARAALEAIRNRKGESPTPPTDTGEA